MPGLIENLLTIEEAHTALCALRPDGNEIEYDQYYALTNDQSLVRLPRLMAFQASVNSSGDFPWYRCTMSSVPQNEIVYKPWTSTIQRIKDLMEQRTGNTWNLAHIIYYRNGEDSMGMHSDTMLDLVPGSTIAVVSFGSTRQLDLLKKCKSTLDGPSQMQFDLPHNSVFLLDEETNRHYVHGIRKMKKNDVHDRIAIVFRHVSTFKTEQGEFYGLGSAFLTRQDIIQHKTQRKIFLYLFSFFVTSLLIWLSSAFSMKGSLIIAGAILWYLIAIVLQQIEQVIHRHRNKATNERLQKLCQMKNFQVWNQTDMRAFLNYS